MSEHETNSNSSNSGLAFIVGALVVAVVALGYVLFSDAELGGSSDDVTISIEGAGDAMEDAGQAVEGAVEDATN